MNSSWGYAFGQAVIDGLKRGLADARMEHANLEYPFSLDSDIDGVIIDGKCTPVVAGLLPDNKQNE